MSYTMWSVSVGHKIFVSSLISTIILTFYSRSYAEDVTSVTSGASQGPHSFNSRSYAEDVTSVTSGVSQGPHSFNLVFVCVFVCVTPGAIRI